MDSKLSSSKIFTSSCIEVKKDEIDEKYEKCHSILQKMIHGLSDKECNDILNSTMCKDKQHEEIVTLGLLTSILTEPLIAAKSYRDLSLVSRDGLTSAVTALNELLARWPRMTDTSRVQFVYIIGEMIRGGIGGVDSVVWNLLRYAAGGDTTAKNILLVTSLLNILQENKIWLEKHPIILANVVYTYLRLIEDHSSPPLLPLRQREVTFVVTLLREKWSECVTIGRDLVRVLQNVARIPEFDALWRQMILQPQTLSPKFTGILQILQTRTSRRFLQSRLTPDMERKLVFLTSNVKFGLQKRFQDWFTKQYLSTPESQALRYDVIRFIVGVIHPTNELLCSDIIPRWAVIGWLLTSCSSPVVLANCKLALFYDWLCYDPDKDNIMNIEPAMLLMFNSIPKHASITAGLLDFLCRIILNFHPSLTDRIKTGIVSSIQQILDKRVLVLPNLNLVLESAKLDSELRAMVQDIFGEFCRSPPSPPLPGGGVGGTGGGGGGGRKDTPQFSDEEDEGGSTGVGPHPNKNNNKKIIGKLSTGGGGVNAPLPPCSDLLIADMKNHMSTLYSADNDSETKCESMDSIVELILKEDYDQDTLNAIGNTLAVVLHSQLTTNGSFPENPTSEYLEDSIGRPLCVLFRSLCQLREDDSRFSMLACVLSELYSATPCVGYLLLYYLYVSSHSSRESQQSYTSESMPNPKMNSNNNENNNKSFVYKEFCSFIDKELESCLLTDLTLCQENDPNLLCYLVPYVYNEFPEHVVNNGHILNVVVGTIDAKQLLTLISLVIQGRLVMMKGSGLQTLLQVSLTWETFEQMCLWQLLSAHDISLPQLLPILPRLKFSFHAEALSAILLLLKQEKPDEDLLKQVLCREVKPLSDMFVVSILQHWCHQDADTLAEIISDLLSTRCPATSPNKRKRGGQGQGLGAKAGVTPPSAERILGHLERVRYGCKTLFMNSGMQRALSIAQACCTGNKSYESFQVELSIAQACCCCCSSHRPSQVVPSPSVVGSPRKSATSISISIWFQP
uniref:SOSS complex subunit A homolog n=1 Tax=Cacopsylla melanoneura TaxID=428564 RepID=A0A8D8V715_9HEMI